MCYHCVSVSPKLLSTHCIGYAIEGSFSGRGDQRILGGSAIKTFGHLQATTNSPTWGRPVV